MSRAESRASSIYIGADQSVTKGLKDGQKEWIKEHGDKASVQNKRIKISQERLTYLYL